MANTQPIRLTASLVDQAGVRAVATAYGLYDPAATIGNLKTDLDAYLTAVQSVSNAGLVGGTVTMVETGSPVGDVAADATSDIVRTIVMDYLITESKRLWGFAVPSVLPAALVAGRVNLGQTGVAALATLMSTAGAHLTYTSAEYDALGAIVDAFRGSRKHRRAEHTRSVSIA